MPSFGGKSTTALSGCHQDIQSIMREVVKWRDISIIEGQRTAERQHYHWAKGRQLRSVGLDHKVKDNWKVMEQSEVVTYKDGYEKLSRHQGVPVSEAVDVVPYPEMWGDKNAFQELSGVIKSTQARLFAEGKIVRVLDWGFDLWDFDAPHYQLRDLT